VTNAGGNLGRVPNTQISALYAPLRPGVALGGSSVDNQIRANARVQAALLSQTSPALLDATRTPNQLKIVPAYYDLGTGRVTELPPLVSVTASP
jgi:carbonic anhydrase